MEKQIVIKIRLKDQFKEQYKTLFFDVDDFNLDRGFYFIIPEIDGNDSDEILITRALKNTPLIFESIPEYNPNPNHFIIYERSSSPSIQEENYKINPNIGLK